MKDKNDWQILRFSVSLKSSFSCNFGSYGEVQHFRLLPQRPELEALRLANIYKTVLIDNKK